MAMAPETITEVIFDPERAKVLAQRARSARTGPSTCSSRPWTGAPRASRPRRCTTSPTRAVVPATSPSGPPSCTRTASTSTSSARRPPARCARSTVRAWSCTARWEYPDLGDHITSPAFAPRGAAPRQLLRRRARRPRRLRGAAGLQRRRVPRRAVRRRRRRGRAGRDPGRHQPRDHPAGAALGVDAAARRARRRRAAALLRRGHRRGLATVPDELHASVHEVARECDELW